MSGHMHDQNRNIPTYLVQNGFAGMPLLLQKVVIVAESYDCILSRNALFPYIILQRLLDIVKARYTPKDLRTRTSARSWRYDHGRR